MQTSYFFQVITFSLLRAPPLCTNYAHLNKVAAIGMRPAQEANLVRLMCNLSYRDYVVGLNFVETIAVDSGNLDRLFGSWRVLITGKLQRSALCHDQKQDTRSAAGSPGLDDRFYHVRLSELSELGLRY